MTRLERTERVLKRLRGLSHETQMLYALLESDWVTAGPFAEENFDHAPIHARIQELDAEFARAHGVAS